MSLNRYINHIAVSICCFYVLIDQYSSGRKLFLSMEHPKITFANPKFVRDLTVTSKRLSRQDPVHYLTINLTLLCHWDKLIKLDVYFYELLSNVYKRSFVEWHQTGCEFLESKLFAPLFHDVYFKSTGRQLKCPLPPSNYSFVNIKPSLPTLINTFPFQQGRLYVNVSRVQERATEAYIDFQIKSFQERKTNISK